MQQTDMVSVQLIQEPDLEFVTHASLDGKEYVEARFVGMSVNQKKPYICRRIDTKRNVLSEYRYVKSTRNTTYIIYGWQKYSLTPVE